MSWEGRWRVSSYSRGASVWWPCLHQTLLELFGGIGSAMKCLLLERCNSFLVTKKGDLRLCNNFCLLDVAGKLLGKIVQEQPQCVAEISVARFLVWFL